MEDCSAISFLKISFFKFGLKSFNFIFHTEVWLTYNVVLVSGIQKNWFDYKYILFQVPFCTGYYKILSIVTLCSHFKSPFRDNYLLTLKKDYNIAIMSMFLSWNKCVCILMCID